MPTQGIMTPPRLKSPPDASVAPRMSLFKRTRPPMPKPEQPDSWRAFIKPPAQAKEKEPPLNLDARAQAFLKRIAPLSADLAAHGRTRALALKKLHRICQAEVRRLKASYTPATVHFYLSKYRDSIRTVEPDHLVLRPRKIRSGQRCNN